MKRTTLFALAALTGALSAAGSVTVTVTHTSIGVSEYGAGTTLAQSSLTSAANPTALTAGRALLADSVSYVNQYMMGWGSTHNLWPTSTLGYDFTKLDPRVDEMNRSGATMMITFCGCPDWMKGGADGETDWSKQSVAPLPESDGHFHHFATLCAAVASRYNGINYPVNIQRFQVWSELKGMWSSDPGASAGAAADNAAGHPRWDYERYTTLYNDVWAAVKAVRPDAQIGGPYITLKADGDVHYYSVTSASNVYGAPVSNVYGYWDSRDFDMLRYWMHNRTGADFIIIDGKTLPHDGILPATWDDFQAGKKFQDAITTIRSWDPGYYYGAGSTWVSWAEWYAFSQYPGDEDVDNALMAAGMSYTIKGLCNKVLTWEPEGNTCGYSHPLGEWTSTMQATGGQATAWHSTQKSLRDYFSSGTQLWTATSSDPAIAVLAGATKTMLVNTTNSSQNVYVNGSLNTLAAYEVRFVTTP